MFLDVNEYECIVFDYYIRYLACGFRRWSVNLCRKIVKLIKLLIMNFLNSTERIAIMVKDIKLRAPSSTKLFDRANLVKDTLIGFLYVT